MPAARLPIRIKRLVLGVEVVDQQEGGSGYYCGGGDGKNPGPDDTTGDAPADSREAMQGAYSDDGAGNGVSGADRNAGECCAK